MSVNSEAIVGRHARAIRILTCLQAGPVFNAKELADRMHVSRRTIYRDLNLIRDAGIRVQFDSENSGYRIKGGPDKPLTPPSFGERDLAKLALTSHFSLLHGLPEFTTSIRESLARLLSQYPNEVRSSVTRLLNCCAVDLPRPTYSRHTLEVIEMLLSAITRHRQVRLELAASPATGNQPASTRFSAYQLIAAMDDWWVVGRSSLHRKTVRLGASTIRSVQPLDQTYTIPHGFRSRMRGHPPTDHNGKS